MVDMKSIAINNLTYYVTITFKATILIYQYINHIQIIFLTH